MVAGGTKKYVDRRINQSRYHKKEMEIIKKFEVIKNSVEISYKEVEKIVKGCTTNHDGDQEPEVQESFDMKEKALKALEKYDTDIRRLSGGSGTYYQITEYYVEENEYDEDGEWESGGDIWKYTEMPDLKKWRDRRKEKYFEKSNQKTFSYMLKEPVGSAFKAACIKEGIPQSRKLMELMEEFIKSTES